MDQSSSISQEQSSEMAVGTRWRRSVIQDENGKELAVLFPDADQPREGDSGE